MISPNEYDTALRQLKTTKAQLDATEARLKSAEEQLSYTELKSDAAGVITEKGAEGEVVPAGKMVLQVAQQSGRDAVFNVPAQAIRDGLSLGAEGEVWLADHPETKADGKVREHRRRPIRSHATIRSKSNLPIRPRECFWGRRSSGA